MKKSHDLLNQLKDFGLNPKHWELTVQGTKVILSHLKNKHFSLEGRLNYIDKRPEWCSLELKNLF